MSKAVLVISYDLPEDSDEGFKKLSGIADNVRGLFEDLPDVEVRVGIREAADEVLEIFSAGGAGNTETEKGMG